jgi:RNA 2',3'-cyclic 3'-phosphodiesterase
MRLFTAIDIPDDVLGNLTALIERLKPAARIQWSPAANLHITTKFIGEWPEDRLPELKRALAGVTPHAPIPIRIRHVGFFPNPHSPRVFWAGIEAPADLTTLARDTDRATAALGVAPEQRAFSPHLTLARMREPVPLVKLREAIAALDSLDFGSFEAVHFYLYQSRLQAGGSVYTKLSEFPLSK